ncbi:DUF5058 family protein [Micrococcus sp.]|uniref:DUF5058 family protein n=1 Tax=Micrococcus sp. TaxID=1271 RepID=UPI002A912501|nr:DUF5058 family protein [Micrococcus sp.]MDY6056079.1 DUF5058 family protein [Micrococcus sp.]
MPVPALTGTVDPSSTDILALANHPLLWLFALGVFAIILVQSFLYVRAARRAAPDLDIPASELRTAFRSGAIASVGPSLAVVIVAISLLALFGTPAVLVRIGLIGSAAFETGAARIAAGSAGAPLGGPGYDQHMFALAFITMSLGGAGWILATLIFTPLLRRGSAKLSEVNPVVLTVIPAAAVLGAFAGLTFGELAKQNPGTPVVWITTAVSAGVMLLLLLTARTLRADWLKEWALGISILVGLAAAYFAHVALVAPAA